MMGSPMSVFGRIAACLLALLGVIGEGSAEGWPAKAIRMVVAYPPGGANDLLARLVGQKLSEAWGQPVVIDNKPGANALIGTELAAKSAPDGYTVLMGATGGHTINPALYNKLPYDPVKDFLPVTLVASAPIVIIVHPSVPAHSIGELVALAKRQPGRLNYGAGASIFNLAMELLKSRTGADIVYVPYRGSVPALTDLMSGQIQIVADVIQTPLPHIREGTVRALAVTGRTRSAAAPDIPTMAESGIADFEVTAWSGLYVPAGTPAEIVQRIDVETRRLLQDPEIRRQIAQVGYQPEGLGPAEFAALMQRELKQYAEIVATARIPKLD
jgi:tripartite-type tricarboxylate transporter receptor subunit TctC